MPYSNIKLFANDLSVRYFHVSLLSKELIQYYYFDIEKRL